MIKTKHAGFALFVVSVLFTCLLLEGGIRLVDRLVGIRFYQLDFPDRKAGIYQYDADIGWKYKPNYSRYLNSTHGRTFEQLNNAGFRDRDFKIEKDQEVFRIAVLGCSFTYGFGVNNDETYPKVLERLLNNESSRPVEVMNFGVNGYSIGQMLLSYEKYVRQYKPDLVVLQLFDMNIYRELFTTIWRTPKPKFEYANDKLKLYNHPVRTHRFHPLEQWMIERSMLYKFVKEKILSIVSHFTSERNTNIIDDKKLHQTVAKILERFQNIVEENDGELVAFVKRIKNPWITNLCQEAEVNCFNINQYENLNDWLKKGDLMNPPPVYHFSVLGNQYAAQAILNYLKEKNVGKLF